MDLIPKYNHRLAPNLIKVTYLIYTCIERDLNMSRCKISFDSNSSCNWVKGLNQIPDQLTQYIPTFLYLYYFLL